jgi:hypothetical protein
MYNFATQQDGTQTAIREFNKKTTEQVHLIKFECFKIYFCQRVDERKPRSTLKQEHCNQLGNTLTIAGTETKMIKSKQLLTKPFH